MHRRVRLPVPEDPAPEAFRVAPGFRYRRPGRKADRTVLRERMGEGARRYLHVGEEAQGRPAGRAKALAKPRSRNLFSAIEARRTISLDRFIYALGIRHVGETTALALARGYGSWKAFHDAGLEGRQGRRGHHRRNGCARSDRRHGDRCRRRLFRRKPQPRHCRAADQSR